jgi:uncharacterized protein (TIGR03067 family)
MKTSRIGALGLAVAVAFVVAGPRSARAQAVSGDLAKIQGHWWTRFTPAGGGRPIVQFFDIQGDVVTGTNEDPDSKSVGRVKLNESASPKAIDFVGTVANTRPLKDIKMPDTFGIYETDGQTLKIALNTGILNSKRPTEFKFDYRNGVSVMIYRRGEPTPEETPAAKAAMPRAAAKPAHVERTASFPGATVEGIVDRKIHFRAADGREVVTGVRMERVLDAQGKPYPNGLYFMWPGNVVDVTVAYADRPNQLDQIKEVRLVRGKVERLVLENIAPTGRMGGAAKAGANSRVTYLPSTEGVGLTYQGAVITKVSGLTLVLDVGGRTIELNGGGNRDTVAFDQQGNRMPVGDHRRLLKAGNKVDLEFRPKRNPNDPNEGLFIRTIRLVEGKVGDLPR